MVLIVAIINARAGQNAPRWVRFEDCFKQLFLVFGSIVRFCISLLHDGIGFLGPSLP